MKDRKRVYYGVSERRRLSVMYTDMVSIECPNCGGHIEREESEFFAKCPYCGVEVGFDEIAEEAEIGGLKSEVNSLRSREREEANRRWQFSRWIKLRNIMIGGVAILHLLGFTLVGIASDVQPRRDLPMGFGVIFCLLAWIGAVAVPIILAAQYPDHNIVTGKKERAGKLKAFAKVLGICICLLFLSAFLAYLILRFTVGI